MHDKMRWMAALAVAALVLVLAAPAQQKSDDKAVDPVCGMTVTKAKAAATYEYKGTTYYFCSASCKDAFAKEPEKYLAKSSPKAEDKAVCPVCGMKVDKATAKATYDYKGKTYYFCCSGCKEKFVKDPEKYLNKKPGAAKGMQMTPGDGCAASCGPGCPMKDKPKK